MLLNKKLMSRQGSQMSEEMNYTDSGLKRSKTYRKYQDIKERAPLFDDIIPDDAKL